MGRETGKSSTCGFVLIRRTQSPESDGPTAELSEPTFELGLRCVVRQATHVKDFAAFLQKSTNVSVGIHGTGEDIGVFRGRLRFADETLEDSGECNGFLHRAAGGGRGQCLQVEG